ncbi:MAG: L-histidine N(alpha)-methyltransferase [Myxococcota bacterium]
MGREESTERCKIVTIEPEDEALRFADQVAQGLENHPRSLPCRFLYDREGSALFEEICDLPEYYVTRSEWEILSAESSSIAAALPSPANLAELGSGSSRKTRLLIESFLDRQTRLLYMPVDISPGILQESAEALLDAYQGLEVRGFAAEYQDGLLEIGAESERPKLVAWLGSNVGNFERDAAAGFLGAVRRSLQERDRLLLGVDLRKDRRVLERAYDDTRGVTARFNKNLLARINRELDGRFDLGAFAHRARYLETTGRVVMELVSLRDQEVEIEALSTVLKFAEGEAIHTENSVKYSEEEIEELASRSSFRIEARWLDARGWFCLALLAPAAS